MMSRSLLAASVALMLCACGGAGRARSTSARAGVPPANPMAAEKYVQASRILRARDLPRGREARAEALLLDALRIDPSLWEAHYNLGVLRRRRGELRAALESFRAAHRIQPDAGEPALAMAEALWMRGELDEAAELLEAHFERQAGSDSGATQARVAYTSVLRQRGDYDDALEQARAVLVREPGHVEALLEVGRIYREKGELDVAELVFGKAVALDADNPRPHNELGLLFLARGDTQVAFEHFERALSVDAAFAPAQLNRASVLLRAGDYAAAADAYRRVLRDSPGDADARVGLGVSLRGQGKHAAARKQYERVLEDEPNHAAALFDLAVLRAEFLDERPQARPLFERFVAVAPEGEALQTAREYLKRLPPATEPSARPRPGGDEGGRGGAHHRGKGRP
jgi:tetratricopeptide (TPR) repeat protein